MEYINRGSFICDNCREVCKGGCHEKLSDIIKGNLKHYEENKDLIGRKQIIHCLGKYCESPCHLQRDEYTPFNEEDGLKPLFALIKWLGTELNNRFKE